MSMIRIENLSFTYDGSYDPVFENVDLLLDTDWRLGLTGRNGRGKTTLLRILQGELPYRGKIHASVEFEYFPYPVPHPELPALAALRELQPELEDWRLLREMDRLELEEALLDRPFETLSKGEQTKLLLALMFLRDNAFLLIDEPTNHLDAQGRALVSRYLRSKKGFLLVSHDRVFLDGCVDHILSINRADLQVIRGNFSTWWEARQRQDAFEQAENEKLKKEISRLKETAREKSRWSDTAERRKTGINSIQVDNVKGWRPLQGAKAKKQMSRAKAIEKRQQAAIEEKEQLLKNVEYQAALRLAQLPYPGPRLVEVRELSIDYGDGPLFRPLRFELLPGDRMALSGPNGAGKSSLLRLLLGEEVPFTGQLRSGSGLKISYVAQDPGDLRGSLTDYARLCGVDESLFKALLIKLDFKRVQFEKDMSEFSAGQKKKVLIARSLCEKAHLHIWDEPMNYIDVISRMQLEDLILRCRPTLLFVEHDRASCDRVSTQVLELQRP